MIKACRNWCWGCCVDKCSRAFEWYSVPLVHPKCFQPIWRMSVDRWLCQLADSSTTRNVYHAISMTLKWACHDAVSLCIQLHCTLNRTSTNVLHRQILLHLLVMLRWLHQFLFIAKSSLNSFLAMEKSDW